MNRPILIITIGYITGIIWGLCFKINIILLYLFLSILYIIANILKSKKMKHLKKILKSNIIILMMISSVISNIIVQKANFKYNNLYKDKEELNLQVIIVSNKKEKEYYNRYKIKVLNNKYKNTYLYMTTKKELNYGDVLNVKGKFTEPNMERNYKGFNYKEYLKTLKIFGTLKAEKIEKIDERHNAFYYFNKMFLIIKNNIKITYNKTTMPIILGIMIGDTSQIDDETRENFSRSSISHVLAISGLHVSYIIYLIEKSSQKIIGIKKNKIMQIVTLIAYMSITGYSVSVVRASIMGILTNLSFLLYRKNDTITNISLSALILLIYNPFYIYSTSFMFTYAGTIGVVYLRPVIEDILMNIKILKHKDKYLEFCKKNVKFIEAIAVAIAAQMMTLPIIMAKYNMISTTFIITNILINIVIGPIVMGGFTQIIISFFSLKLSKPMSKFIQIPTTILIYISKLGSNLPYSTFKVTTPKTYQVIIYYIILYLFYHIYTLTHLESRNIMKNFILKKIIQIKNKIQINKKKIKIFILIFIIFSIAIKIFPQDLKIYFVDVGQGDCTFIVTPKKQTILIDGGGQKNFDVGTNTLIPYILNRGKTKINYCIISHFDQDHCGRNTNTIRRTKSR